MILYGITSIYFAVSITMRELRRKKALYLFDIIHFPFLCEDDPKGSH